MPINWILKHKTQQVQGGHRITPTWKKIIIIIYKFKKFMIFNLLKKIVTTLNFFRPNIITHWNLDKVWQ